MCRLESKRLPLMCLVLTSLASAQDTGWDATGVKPAPVERVDLDFRLRPIARPGYAKIEVVELAGDLSQTVVALGLPLPMDEGTAPILGSDGLARLHPFAVVPRAALESIVIEIGDANVAKILLIAAALRPDGTLTFSEVTAVGALRRPCEFHDAGYPGIDAAADVFDPDTGRYRLKVWVLDATERGRLVLDRVANGEKTEVYVTFVRAAGTDRPEPVREPHVIVADLGAKPGDHAFVWLRVAKGCGKSPYVLAARALVLRG